jgi:hypothetical protein
MMGAVERIVERFQRRPELAYRVAGQTVTVEPATANGFALSLTQGADDWIVAFDGWYERFATPPEKGSGG